MAIVSCKNVSLKSWAKIAQNKHNSSLCDLMRSGNTKVPRSTGIFNMSSATDCPSKRLGLCKACKQGAKCYALKAEYEYRPDVLPFRRKQEHYWKHITAKQFVSDFVLLNSLKEVPFQNIRFSEAGDFHSQFCVDKLEQIALRLRRFGVRVYCYTSRSDLDFSKVRHAIITGSNFMKKGISNQFRIVNDVKKERMKGEGVCKGDCRVCKLCLMRNMKIVVKKH
jgi:hypothetical protein